MIDGNFSNIDGFNQGPRRERPGLRAAVTAGLLGALLCAVWIIGPYVALLTVIAP